MTYLDIENLLLQYARWVRLGQARLGYPKEAAFAHVIPQVIPDDAVADISDSEGERIGRAMMALKAANLDAHTALEARFVYGIVDDTGLGKRLGLGSRMRVWQLRQQGYSYLLGYFAAGEKLLLTRS